MRSEKNVRLADYELCPVSSDGVACSQALGNAAAEWFLTMDVLAGRGGPLRHRGVKIRGCGNVDETDFRVRQHGLVVAVDFGNVVASSPAPGTLLIGIADGDDTRLGMALVAFDVRGSRQPKADHADGYLWWLHDLRMGVG